VHSLGKLNMILGFAERILNGRAVRRIDLASASGTICVRKI
jgi:hypothetical protein